MCPASAGLWVGAMPVAADRLSNPMSQRIYVIAGKDESAIDPRQPSTVDVPEVRGGSEDDVVALDYDSDGRTDFLALNGRNSVRGPVQLITLEAAG